MNKLKNNFLNFLPVNRKEKFYTATVLPHIICYDNFKHFKKFTSLIPNFPQDIEITPDSEKNNILFLTEYSLTESLKPGSVNIPFVDVPKSKETPDIVILITEPYKILIVIEAKMFSSSDSAKLTRQIDEQKKIINSIKKTLSINEKNIFHFGLVPSKMLPKSSVSKYYIIYWEEILNVFRDLLYNDYFFNVLEIALEKYDILSSQSSYGMTYGKNMDTRLNGEEIVKLHRQGERFWVGRNRGFWGPEFQNDVKRGTWRKFEYEINNTAKNPPNRNWFSSEEFVKAISQSVGKNTFSYSKPKRENNVQSVQYDESELGDWHFSHLGVDYFFTVLKRLGFRQNLNAPIQQIYIGKKGEPYIKKKYGRRVNPNWAVILENGEMKKYSNSRKKLEEGLWKRSNCNVFEWSEIKEFFRYKNS